MSLTLYQDNGSKYVSIRNKNLKDITSLGGMTHIVYLDLSRNQISDISPLASLLSSSLRTFYISHNPIVDISVIRKGAHLQSLVIDGNDVLEDISPLSSLPLLSNVTLGGEKLQDITPLSKVKFLRFLCIRNAPQVKDIGCLMHNTSLTCIHLIDTGIAPEQYDRLSSNATFNLHNESNRYDTLFQILNRWYLKMQWDRDVKYLSIPKVLTEDTTYVF